MEKKILLPDLAELLAAKADITKKSAESFVRAFFSTVEDNLLSDRYVKVKDFGTFKVVTVSERESVNVATGERIQISSHAKVAFTAEGTLRDRVNQPFSHLPNVDLDDDIDNAELEAITTPSEPLVAPVQPTIEAAKAATAEEKPEPKHEKPESKREEPAAVQTKEAPLPEEVKPQPKEVKPQPEEAEPKRPHQYPADETPAKQPNVNPAQPAQRPIQPGQRPMQPGMRPGQPGQRPMQPGMRPGMGGSRPGQPGQRPTQPGQRPMKPGQRPGQPGQRPVQPGMHHTPEEQREMAKMALVPQQPTVIVKQVKEPTNWWKIAWIAAAVVVLLIISFIAGFKMGQQQGTTVGDAKETPTMVSLNDTTAVPETIQQPAANTSTPKAEATPKDNVKESSEAEKKSPTTDAKSPQTEKKSAPKNIPQLAGGAYTIVGTKEVHELKPGEGLYSLARKIYGNAELAKYIVFYNNISNPDVVPVGTKLNIPELQAK